MPKTIQRSFTAGEISPSLQSRADTVKYATGLHLCRDFLVRAQGGVYSRPGQRFIGALKDSTKVGRLIPFSFNTEQTYMLVFEEGIIRVIKDGGFVLKPAATITNVTQANPAVVTTAANHTFVTGEQVTITGVVGMTELNGNTYTITVLSPTTFQLDATDSTGYTAYSSGGSAQSDGIYEVAVSYTESDLFDIDYAQSADVMTLVHRSFDPNNLSRLDHDDWTFAAVNYGTTVVAPNNLTAAAVGTGAGTYTKTYNYVVTAVDDNDVESLASTGVSITTNSLSTTAAVQLKWGTAISGATQANPCVITTATAHGFSTGDNVQIDNVVGMTELNNSVYTVTVLSSTTFSLDGIDSTAYTAYTSGGNVMLAAKYYRVYKDPSNGTGVYGWIGDSDFLIFEDYNIAPITSDAPPIDRQPFSGANDKPGTVGFYQQRQIYANTTNEPQTVFTTQTGNFSSLRNSRPARDDDAITFAVASQKVNEIRHVVALDSLILLTSGGEWLVSEGQDRVLTPSNLGVRPQSYNGASKVKPTVINDTAVYVQEKGARIRDLGSQINGEKYSGDDLSVMSEHLFEGHTIVEMAYADEPYGILWIVRDDGVLLGLTYLREHEVVAWHQHTTDGTYESVATINEDGRDAVYVIVKRTINGVTKRYVERMEPREMVNAEDCFYVDSGLSYEGSTATISGATQANPCVITATAHPFSNGDSIRIEDVVGMTELNDNVYVVANATANTFELTSTDSTAFTAYVSGGVAKQVVTTLSGLGHLEAKAVSVLADGNVVEDITVTSGSITIPRAANKVHVGLPYTPRIELLDIDTTSSTESLKSDYVSVSKVTIEVEDSRGGWVGSRVDEELGLQEDFVEIAPRFLIDGYDTVSLKTYKMEVNINPQWSKTGGLIIEQRAPLPLNILSVIPEVDIGG